MSALDWSRLRPRPKSSRRSVTEVRILHPDVPKTGNADEFVAVKQAYDVLSNRDRRAAYDRKAREAAMDAIEPEVIIVHQPAYPAASTPTRQPRFSDLPIAVWIGSGVFLCLCVYEVIAHLLATPPPLHEPTIRPNAAIVAPLSPSAHQAVLYGPTPVHLPGTPNFYVIPAASPAVLWHVDTEHNALVPLGQLPPFSSVQAVRLVRQNGMLEVLLNDRGNGFISADHLTPGNAAAARRAYCGYNAGPAPSNGERLANAETPAPGRHDNTLQLENRAVQPAVVKLRDDAGGVALAVFLGPGGHAEFDGLPDGNFHVEFAIGELWSRACSSFAAGMRAMQMDAALNLPGSAHLVVAPDAGVPDARDISDQAFERN